MLTVAFIVVIIALWLAYRKRCLSVLKEQGIPGPEPNLLFGNLIEIVRKTPIVCHKEWFEKYGKVVGYYFGMKPVLLVADVEILKKVQVSDFHKFINRPMVPIMSDAIDSLLKNVDKKCENEEFFDIYSMFQGLTMDVIGRTAFGIHADAQNDPNDPFLKFCRMLFSGISITNPITVLSICFRGIHLFWSHLGRLLMKYRNKGTNPITKLIQSVKEVIAIRRSNTANRRPDLLQLMIDAEIDDSNIKTEDLTADADNTIEKTTGGTTSGKLLRRMTDADILDNSLLFFLAGYETTSTALGFTAHFLVQYPDVQEKIRSEVQQICNSEDKLDYNLVNKLQYLEQVLQESMRLYPPVNLFVSRECSEDVTIGTLHLKKGIAVQVPVYHIHRDPELWGPDAEEFKPERFSTQNKSKIHPMAFQAFGQGPRNCVGMRFAYLEAKLALARLLLKYRLVACAKTEKDISIKVSHTSITPKQGVWLKAVPVDR